MANSCSSYTPVLVRFDRLWNVVRNMGEECHDYLCHSYSFFSFVSAFDSFLFSLFFSSSADLILERENEKNSKAKKHQKQMQLSSAFCFSSFFFLLFFFLCKLQKHGRMSLLWTSLACCISFLLLCYSAGLMLDSPGFLFLAIAFWNVSSFWICPSLLISFIFSLFFYCPIFLWLILILDAKLGGWFYDLSPTAFGSVDNF